MNGPEPRPIKQLEEVLIKAIGPGFTAEFHLDPPPQYLFAQLRGLFLVNREDDVSEYDALDPKGLLVELNFIRHIPGARSPELGCLGHHVGTVNAVKRAAPACQHGGD